MRSRKDSCADLDTLDHTPRNGNVVTHVCREGWHYKFALAAHVLKHGSCHFY